MSLVITARVLMGWMWGGQLHKLDRHDLEEALLAFPEMANIIASQASAQTLTPVLLCPMPLHAGSSMC